MVTIYEGESDIPIFVRSISAGDEEEAISKADKIFSRDPSYKKDSNYEYICELMDPVSGTIH